LAAFRVIEIAAAHNWTVDDDLADAAYGHKSPGVLTIDEREMATHTCSNVVDFRRLSIDRLC
jgi:hypothetical protein